MTEPITRLTEAQAGRMPEWAAQWIAIGLSCEPADWEMAERGIRDCYAAAGLVAPPITRVGSPFVACFGGPIAESLIDQSGYLDSAVRSAVESAVYSAVYSAVRSAVESAVDAAVDSAVDSAVGAAVDASWVTYRGGQFWASWYAYISFFCDICSWHHSSVEAFRADEAVARSAGLWWLGRQTVMLSDRPLALHRNARGQLHHDGGPALEFRDGWALWMLNGVRVPETLVLAQPFDLDARRWVVKESNAEIRREAVRKIGVERVCAQLGATVIARGQDHAGQPCELLNLDLGDGRRRPYIKLVHPGVGTYHLEGVPPDCTTLDAAFRFRNGTAERPAWLR